ncbi:iron ABC transporter substrate-binding protein [Conexibacter sp. SYSU D00693]|uniref:iron ABC transporter substrate-binding protein n=1 Tax=Conexibacter sp. SYSU D00693 TaxID=2812560 RepID=UPI00196A2A1E|nr:iron ABC transporter substrate-binding protein [Conexibacter sp. SYSU D00693]
MKRTLLAILALALPAAVAGCGDDEPSSSSSAGGGDGQRLTVYSGRNERLVGDLFKQFTKATGVQVQVRYGDSAELAATIAEEGDASPADVFFSQDAGALGAVQQAGLLAPVPAAAAAKVPERFRTDRWIGTSGRARVVAYSTERLKASQLPSSILDFCDDRWEGKIGFPPPNASFQSFVSAMRIALGEERARDWLECMERQDPTLLENNIQTEEAIADGEIDVGFVNHYYLPELKAERPGFPVANHFLKAGDPGSLVNVAGVGLLASSERQDAARRFLDHLLSPAGQRYFSTRTFEYPLVAGIPRPRETRPLEDVHGPDIALSELGEKLPSTLELLQDVGLVK